MTTIRYNLRSGAIAHPDKLALRPCTMQWQLLVILLAGRGRWVWNADLYAKLWSGAIMPDDPRNNARTQICRLRKWLAGTGYRIDIWWGQGYRICFQSVTRKPQPASR